MGESIMDLPAGFVLDKPKPQDTGLPAGFMLDEPPPKNPVTQREPVSADIPSDTSTFSYTGPPSNMGSSLVRAGINEAVKQTPGILGSLAAGAPEAALSIGSGVVAEPLAGLSGIAQSLVPGGNTGSGAETVEQVRNALTFEPRSKYGKGTTKAIGQGLGYILDPVLKGINYAGEKTTEVTGSPAIGAGVKAGLTALPEILGAKSSFAKPASRSITSGGTDLTRAAERASRDTGIDLFEAQQTLNPYKIEQQAYVQRLPEGVRRSAEALEKQNVQASNAVNTLINEIAPANSIGVGPGRFRTAAERAVKAKNKAREEAASPIYKEAFAEARRNGTDIDVSDIKNKFDNIVSDFPSKGETAQSVRKAIGFLESGDLKMLHNAKIEIDRLINNRVTDSVGATSKAKLVELKNDLVSRLAEKSPTYEKARAEFERLSPGVKDLEESIIGRIANFDDAKLKSISKKIFDPTETNPQVIANAKKVISSVDPEAWAMITRAEIERRAGSMKARDVGATENIPSKLQTAIFGNKASKDVLLKAASPETRRALESLDTALNRAALGRDPGSPTAIRKQIDKELRGGKLRWVKDLFTNTMETAIRTGEDAGFNRRTRALTEALFNPKYQAETTKLIKTGRDKELIRLILSIEALKQSEIEGKDKEPQQEQTQQ